MNKRNLIFISYYTTGVYEKVANEYLLPSLKKHSLPFDVEKVLDLGNWWLNTAYKPTYILKMLEKHKKDVVFVDADATILQFPVLFYEIPKEYDIAVHYLDWYKFWHNKEDGKRFDLLSGTMLFSYNEKVLDLTKEYIKECQAIKNSLEQRILQEIIEKDKTLKVYNLPPSYTAIIKPNGTVPEYIRKPIILHHQASRQYRNKRS